MALTAAQILEVKKRRLPPTRETWEEIARDYGVTSTTVRMDCDPVYRAKRMEQINVRRRAKPGERVRTPKAKHSLTGFNHDGNNGSLVTRLRKKQKPNFATFGHSTEFPAIATLPVPDMDDSDIVGVDWHANDGCKYILGDRRGGPQNLPLCCGAPRSATIVKGVEIKSPYCKLHSWRTGTGNYGRSR